MMILIAVSSFLAGILTSMYVWRRIPDAPAVNQEVEHERPDTDSDRILDAMVTSAQETERAIEAYNHYSYLAEQLKLSLAELDARRVRLDQDMVAMKKAVRAAEVRADRAEARLKGKRGKAMRQDKDDEPDKEE